MLSLWILAFIIACVKGGPAFSNKTEIGSGDSVVEDSFMRCTHEEGVSGIFHCAAKRALKMINQVKYLNSIELLPGIALTSETPTSRDPKAIYEETDTVEENQSTEKLIRKIANEAVGLVSGRTLSIKLPETTPLALASALEEGRAKMKKKMGMNPMMLGLGIKALLLKALFILGIGAMAIKALFVSKVALLLAILGAGQSLFSVFSGGLGSLKGGGALPGLGAGTNIGSSYGPPGWTSNSIGGGWSNSQYPYARSIDNAKDQGEDLQTEADELAYSAYKQ